MLAVVVVVGMVWEGCLWQFLFWARGGVRAVCGGRGRGVVAQEESTVRGPVSTKTHGMQSVAFFQKRRVTTKFLKVNETTLSPSPCFFRGPPKVSGLVFSGSLSTAMSIVGSDFVTKSGFMFAGERLWNRVSGGAG